MERRALILEHHVIRTRHAHNIVDPGCPKQSEQRIHVILVSLSVIGVADITSHRQSKQLAAEVVLQPSAKNLFAIVKILRPNKADNSIDKHRRESPRHGIRASLTGLLIHPMMSVRR